MSNVKTKYDEQDSDLTQRSIPNYVLIEGQFSPTEAKEVIMELVSSKILFQSKKNLRSYEQTGQPDSSAEQRITELENMRHEILELMKHAEEQDMMLHIHSEIDIKVSLKNREEPT